MNGLDDWREHAACRPHRGDPLIIRRALVTAMYPPEPQHPGRDRNADSVLARQAYAKAVCATCPVKTDCLETAMANDEPCGVWGGLTRRERNQLQRSRETAA